MRVSYELLLLALGSSICRAQGTFWWLFGDHDDLKAQCKDISICKGEKVVETELDGGCFGAIKTKYLDNYGPFDITGIWDVLLTVEDDKGLSAECTAKVDVRNCSPVQPLPVPAPVPLPAPISVPRPPAPPAPVRSPLRSPVRSPVRSHVAGNTPPKAKCKDVTICKGSSITVADINRRSRDYDGTIVSMKVNKNGPFTTVGAFVVKLTVKDNKGAKDRCRATVFVTECSSPTAPVSAPVRAIRPSAPVPAPTAPSSVPTGPKSQCKDTTVCVGQALKPEDVDNGSYDPSGSALAKNLFNNGPFLSTGSQKCTLTVTNSKGLSDECTANVEVVDCSAPAPAPTPGSKEEKCFLWLFC